MDYLNYLHHQLLHCSDYKLSSESAVPNLGSRETIQVCHKISKISAVKRCNNISKDNL